MKNHIEKKKTLLDLQQKEIRELEKGHIDKISSLHEKFEHDLEKVRNKISKLFLSESYLTLLKKKAALEAKRKVFDQRVEKWEADHSDRKMTWASANHTRKTEFENHSVYRLADTLKNLSQSQEDSPMTRNDLDSSNITSPQVIKNSPFRNRKNLRNKLHTRDSYYYALEKKTRHRFFHF